MSDTPRTDGRIIKMLSALQSGTEDVVRADFARELERELSAQIEGHKLTAKEASEAAVLRASLNAVHTAANRVAELFSAQYMRAHNDGGRVFYNHYMVPVARHVARLFWAIVPPFGLLA